MSRSSPLAQEPRRGGRSRKVVERFEPGGDAAGRKGKGRADDDEDDESSEDDGSEDEGRPLKPNKRVANGARKTKVPSARTGKNKAAAETEGSGPASTAPQADGEGIKTDSPLFNALLSPDIALETVVDDWVENYQSSANDEPSERTAVHELVLCLIRCCGINADVDEDEAMDVDGVTDVIERIQDETIRTSAAVYPLISRIKNLRPFKGNLNNLITTLIKTLSLTPILYATSDNTAHSTPLLPLILNWLQTMASSPLRPIRHTSTYLSLKINSALCEVAAEVSKDLGLRQRQRDAEAKKGGAGAAAQKRVKDAEKKVTEVRERKAALEGFMQDIFDVVFVHRVRDSDAAIRADCLRELGVWVKLYAERYVHSAYLNYFVRGCNDPDSHARLETAKSLASLFSRDTFVRSAGTSALRLAPRLIEMALRDVDLSVRVNAIHVIAEIDKTGILADDDEEQRLKVARLVFDAEPRVRKAAGGFLRGLWEERAEKVKADWEGARGNKKKRGAKIDEETMAGHLEWKALASLLVETSTALDEPSEDPAAGPSRPNVLLAPQGQVITTRASAAVESLAPEIEKVQDWEGLVDYLLLDHSTADQDAWLLDEDEENFMIQLLIACINHEDKEEEDGERTKKLMTVLPRLFAKHQADVSRIAGILSIPERMNLALYLDMRKSTAYDSLWDDITKQFLQHTEPLVLVAAIQAINHLSANASMSAANAAKLLELQESLFTSLRDALNGEEVATLALTEDQVTAMESILLRISLLERSRDLTEVMEDDEGGQSSGWDIVCAFAERGELGYKEEAKLVEYAVNIVFLHLTWLFKKFAAEDAEDEAKLQALQAKRDKAVEIFQRLTIRAQTNVVEPVRRQAFICFVNAHVLFSPRSPAPAAKAASLKMADEVQHRLGGAFQAAVERYASDRDDEAGNEAQEEDSVQHTQSELLFLQLASVFVAAIRTGVLEVEHAKEPLAHYGRFGPTYDAIVKKLVDVLRDEGIYNRESDMVQAVASMALQSSFSTFLESDGTDPAAAIALAKVLASSFVVHGTHFNVLKQIKPDDVHDLHMGCIDWISRKVSGFVKQEAANKNREAKARLQAKRFQALTFFRPLALLISPITGRDAIRIRNHLQEQMEGTGARMDGGKQWDSYRAYEKRLVSVASRDENMKNASRRVVADSQKVPGQQGTKRKAAAAAGDGEEGDEEVRMEGSGSPSPEPTPSKKRRLGPAPTSKRNDEAEADADEGDMIVANEAGAIDNANGNAHGETVDNLDLDVDLDLDLDLEMPELPLEMHEDLDLDLDLELELPDLVPGSSQGRERSVSVDPVPRRKKLARKF